MNSKIETTKEMIKRYNSLQEIPARNYEGYLWNANEEKPFLLLETSAHTVAEWEKESYLVEGLLYSKEDNISILIRHTGSYCIREYNLNELPTGAELSEERFEYLAHRLPKIEKLRFRQLWESEPDPNCDNMEVLNLKALIFVGFVHTKKKENA